MIVDPRYGFYLSIILAVFGVLATSATQLTTIFGDHTTAVIVAVAMLLMTVGNAVNAILHAMPASPPANAKAAAEFPLGPKA
jgi:hypothetical protein